MWSWVGIAAAAPPADLAQRWDDVADEIRDQSPVPVPLSAADIARLGEGAIPASRYDTPSGSYATGALWVDAPLDAVWVVLQDAPHDPPSRVTLERLPAPAGLRRVYMRLDLPFPLSDRQWVAEVRTNRGLYDATGGVVWQREWSLGDPASAPHADPSGVWVQESRGAWTLMEVEGGTLVLFSVRSKLGGALPESITNTFAVAEVRTAMAQLAHRASTLSGHYVSGHEVVLRPDGTAVAYR